MLPLLKWLWVAASSHDRGTVLLSCWVNTFLCLQSDFDKNSKEVTPFSSAFTRQREIWAGRTASTPLSAASQVTLHLTAHTVHDLLSLSVTMALSFHALGVEECAMFLYVGFHCSDRFLLRLHWRADHWQGCPWPTAAGDQAATERHQLGRFCHCGTPFCILGLFFSERPMSMLYILQ